MNFIYCTAIATLIFANCSFAQTTKKKNILVKKTTSIVTSVEDIKNGKALIQKSDCMACHKTDVKLVGPGFVQIAKKYPATEANYTLLADKIINGGTGVWGQIPMAAHSTLSKPEAKKMVKYILSLK